MKWAHHPVDATHALKVILHQIAETDRLVKVFLPALDASVDTNGDKALLADGAAVASGIIASRHVCEGIGQIVKLALIKQLRWHVVLEPEDLRDLHLNAHCAADIAEQVVLCSIDLLRLLNRTVVEPENHIASIAVVFKIGTSDCDWLVGDIGKDSQRAGCIETNTLDGVGISVGLVNHLVHARADTRPNVRGRLFLSL